MDTRIVYYLDKREQSQRVKKKVGSLASQYGGEISAYTHIGDEVSITVSGISALDRELFQEMVAETLDLYNAVASKDQLKAAAKQTARTLMEDPAYRYAPGVYKLTEITRRVAEELGHSEWLNDDNHWLYRLVSSEAS